MDGLIMLATQSVEKTSILPLYFVKCNLHSQQNKQNIFVDRVCECECELCVCVGFSGATVTASKTRQKD